MGDFDLLEIKKLAAEFSKNPPPTGDQGLDEIWEREEFRQPYYRFFHHLTKTLKPNIVLELGTWRGVSAAHFAAGNPDTRVITVDHHTDPGDNLNQKWVEDLCRLYPNIEYIQGWTCNEIYEEEKNNHFIKPGKNAYPVVTEKIRGHGIDFFFIDSWHMEKQARRDWDAYSDYLNPGALVICDDLIGGHGPAIGGMRDFWEGLPGEKVLVDELHKGYPMGFLKV